MKINHDLRKLKTRKSYSNKELAEVLSVHIQTVRGWRKKGLKPIDEADHRPLYLGSAIQIFLKEKSENGKIKLKPNEFYCFGCQDKTIPINTIEIFQNSLIGKDKKSMRAEGKCPKCDQKVNKFIKSKAKDLDRSKVISRGLSSSL